MALVECKEPVFDRKVDQVLELLEEGVDRASIADKLGYTNPMSLDNYMRRRNFSWDSRQQNFVPALERYSGKGRDNPLLLRGISKVELILNLFEQGESDAKDIAKQVGIDNHTDLANYMKEKGYAWNPEQGNYIKVTCDKMPNLNNAEGIGQLAANSSLADVLDKIIPLIQGIQTTSAGANDVVKPAESSNSLPRYNIKGKYGNKAMRMANALDDLTIVYSRERKIPQREIMEIALIEFFQKYGYAERIDDILCG